MRRLLAGFEAAAALTGETHALNAVMVLRLAGDLDPVRLGRALAALQRRHPLLAARVVGEGRRHRFVEGAPPVPLEIVDRAGGATWHAVVEAQLDQPVDLAIGPPLRCVLLRHAAGRNRSELVLTVHHAVIDGASSAPLLGELLRLCWAKAQPALAGARWPPAAGELFPRRARGPLAPAGRLTFLARQLGEEIGHRLRGPLSPRPPGRGPAANRILPVVLDAPTTAALVGRSRRERATLNGALNAALLLAVQRHLHGGRRGSMRYFAFADLRPYLRPTPGAETVAAYVSALRHAISLPERPAFWPLARRVSRQLAAAGRRGDKFHAERLMPATMRRVLRRPEERMATVALSYAGAVRLAEVEAPRIEGLHAFVSNLPQGPEFTASVKLVGERLVWDMVYLEADLSRALARTVAGEIVRTLSRHARPRTDG